MPRRKLIKGDRVKITGPWSITSKEGGNDLIGKHAKVVDVLERSWMPIILVVKGHTLNLTLAWDRENLRALPRKKS